MKLYYSPGACSLSPHIVLHESGLAFEAVMASTKSHKLQDGTDYYSINPLGYVPLLELDDGRVLPESNAILCYLAEGSPLLPAGRFERAEVLQWLFFEQYSHEPYVAVARFIAKFLPADHPRRADLPRLREKSREALGVMETALAKRAYLASSGFGIADIALFAYTHEAPAAGIALDDFPAVGQWLDRVRAQPGFVPQ